MIVKIKDSEMPPLVITLPVFWVFVCRHIMWILGLLASVLAHILPMLPPEVAYWVLMVYAVVTTLVGYIKTHGNAPMDFIAPPPILSPAPSRGPP